MKTLKDYTVGQEVVAFHHNSPVQHNTANSPAHPCRGIVTVVGRKYITITSGTATFRLLPTKDLTKVSFHVMPIAEAKEFYRSTLTVVKNVRTQAQINAFVAKL